MRDGICNIALITLHSYTNLIYLAGGKLLKELKMQSALPYAELPTDVAGVQHATIFDFNSANFGRTCWEIMHFSFLSHNIHTILSG